ncbi:MAG: hybrid sensor histidine kinase/response regulator [Chloroflexi bacterium]|nr:hybrid sensor histidine kinase/response regulator [Chloroflexota bacterium]
MTTAFDTLRTGQILIVDDNLKNINLLRRILAAEGYVIHTALDGQTALDAACSIHPDIILLDIQMPDMDGYEVCQVLKADPHLCDIPVLFISALTDTDGIVRALGTGGVDYITKPFKIQEVVARVNSQFKLVQQRHQIEHLREQDRQQYETLDKMKNDFIHMATHDLKNPLHVIIGFATLLEAVEVQPEHERLMHDALDSIQHASQKMRTLVADILDLAKMGTGAEIQFSAVPFIDQVQKWVAGFGALAKRKPLDLMFEPLGNEFTVSLDAPRFERVVDNLVSNAIKYTPAGGWVKVAVESQHDRALLQIIDNGLGIPEEDQTKIFDAFYRVGREEHLEAEGTGLGLSIVKTIVEQHGGEIVLDSQLGQGTTFSVYLPCA